MVTSVVQTATAERHNPGYRQISKAVIDLYIDNEGTTIATSN